MVKCDCSGWATKNDLLCSDGKIIRKNAFAECDGKEVPVVWNHQHNDPTSVLGHAVLENREDGVYAYISFNDSTWGTQAKSLVKHGDIVALSIFANGLKCVGSEVMHGIIREVSLVMAGANPGASIDHVICHAEDTEEAGVIYTGERLVVCHSDEPKKEDGTMPDETKKDKTVADIVNSMTDEQREVMYGLIGKAMEGEFDDEIDDENDDEGEDNQMKHNIFEGDNDMNNDTLMHDAMNAIIGDAKRYGSMKESFLQHADTYGIEQIDYLVPDAKTVTNTPTFIERDMTWVREVMSGVHHTPFSRIKSLFADITEDEARAKGYIKGKLKKEEVFSLLKRTTTPTTVYKKQKMDRDDVVDITGFDVITWLKTEMRRMLDEELARAYLVGDGRLASDDDKINETCIRPIWTDQELFTIRARFKVKAEATADDKAKAFIRAAVKARKDYKGSGNPDLFTTEDILSDCLLLTDEMGRDLYDSVEKLAKKLRVRRIVTVPVMEGKTREESGTTYQLFGLIVNLADYNVGADKGGAVNMFEDFDIDYNQQKYLIETRCSGALTRPHSAIAVELDTTNHLS